MYIQPYTNTRISHKYTNIPIYTQNKYTQTHTHHTKACAHHTYIQMHTLHTHTHTFYHIHTTTLTDAIKYSGQVTCAWTAHTHACTHTHTHTHTCTQT